MKNRQMSDCTACKVRCQGPMAGLSETALKTLNQEKIVRTYQPGQIIFYEDNKPFGIYCLEKGKVKLTKYTPDGKTYITRIVQAGDLLGYRAFLTKEPYAATAEVIEEATVCFLDSAAFMKAIELNPNFSLQLIELLGQELKQAENQARDLAYKSVAERLVELLLSMKDKYGKIQPDGAVLLDILLSREEMASMLGTTVETTVRTLSRFKENQLIEHKQRKMVLKDIQKLTEYLPSTN